MLAAIITGLLGLFGIAGLRGSGSEDIVVAQSSPQNQTQNTQDSGAAPSPDSPTEPIAEDPAAEAYINPDDSTSEAFEAAPVLVWTDPDLADETLAEETQAEETITPVVATQPAAEDVVEPAVEAEVEPDTAPAAEPDVEPVATQAEEDDGATDDRSETDSRATTQSETLAAEDSAAAVAAPEASPEASPEAEQIQEPSEPPSFVELTGEEVVAGRVTYLEPFDIGAAASVRILEGPDAGNVSVNPDNSLAVVLPDPETTGVLSFSYEVTYQDGSVEVVEHNSQIVPGSQEDGWGQGDFYMLETDENGDVIVETGDDHRPIYVSGSDDALSRADIAAMEGLQESQITDAWLVDNPAYGGSEDMALDTEAGIAVWYATTYEGDRETSNWLLFEKGYVYENIGRLIEPAASGEDELHPLHITSYGEGELPVINDFSRIYQMESHNIVFSDVHFGGDFQSLSGHNIIFDDVRFSGENTFQFGSGLTIRDSKQYGISTEEPSSGGDYFHPHVDRIAGIFVNASENVLLEGNLWDQIGWVEGYSFDGLAENGQAPSAYSQNVYVQNTVFDVTFRDNITMRAASFGAQLRGGAFIEDNLFLENNAALNFMGGEYQGAGPIGNYTLFTGNVVTSGQHNNATQIGALTMGVDNGALDSTLYHNVIAHLADPNNPDELAEKEFTHSPLTDGDLALFNDTVIYNWVGTRDIDAGTNRDENTEGLDPVLLDQTTIQIFAAEFLDKPDATVSDLADYLRAQADNDVSGVSNADLINAFFLENFGFGTDARVDPATLRFVPNELADGIRWDNRLNWDTEDLPGTIDGDSVDLAGNFVNYGGTNVIEDLDFGNGGKLTVTHGKLTVAGDIEADDRGATLDIAESGQVWANGYSDSEILDLNINGGRFVNTGTVDGATETTITDGQAILATDGASFDVSAGSSLRIEGSEAQVGFDGDEGDTAVLRIEEGGTLSFVADENGFSAIEEFRSGSMGDAPDVQTGLNLSAADLLLDISGLTGACLLYTSDAADD